MTPQRIQLSRRAGFNLQAASRKLNGLPAVNCARPSKWGNPFKVCDDRSAYKACVMFRALAEAKLKSAIRRELKGKNLACWCGPNDHCHADTLLIIANT